jgi:hypothetical protein
MGDGIRELLRHPEGAVVGIHRDRPGAAEAREAKQLSPVGGEMDHLIVAAVGNPAGAAGRVDGEGARAVEAANGGDELVSVAVEAGDLARSRCPARPIGGVNGHGRGAGEGGGPGRHEALGPKTGHDGEKQEEGDSYAQTPHTDRDTSGEGAG